MPPLTLVSWNLDGLDEHRLDERMEAACFGLLLHREPPDIVLFQEVVDRSFLAHLSPHFRHAGFAAIRQPPLASYGCAAFFRVEICPVLEARVVPFPSTGMGRALLEAEVGWAGQRLWVGTAHLESLREGSAARIEQTGAIAARMLAHPGPALFAGDTNLRDAEAKGIDALSGLQDAWVAAGAPPDRKTTWDLSRNRDEPVRGRPARLRFDRAWLSAGWRVQDFRLLGDTPVAGDRFVSDHLGLEIALSLEG